jgi:hypothetical protein
MIPTDLLSTPEAAGRVGVTKYHLGRWVRGGWIKNYGRRGEGAWSAAEVDAAYQKHLRTTPETIAAERAMRKTGKPPAPPKSSPYRPLASTCRKCGELRTYKTLRKTERIRVIRHDCDRIYDRVLQAERYATDPEFRATHNRLSRKAEAARQAASRDAASHHGETWTGPQLEVATREGLSASQAAAMLGRTISAVRTVRRAVRKDPRKERLLGAPRANP